MVLKPKEIPQNSSALSRDLPPPHCISKSDIDKLKNSADENDDANLNEEQCSTDDANLSDDANSEELSLTSVDGSTSEINAEELSLKRIVFKSESNSVELPENKSVSKSESSLNDCSFSFDLESEALSPQEQADCEKVVLFL